MAIQEERKTISLEEKFKILWDVEKHDDSRFLQKKA
jgi:hypothetical protein